MNTRLAQIIAASIGPDGRPDPSRVYESLRLSPDDPVAVIVEGVIEAKNAQAEHLAAFLAESRQLQENLQRACVCLDGLATREAEARKTTASELLLHASRLGGELGKASDQMRAKILEDTNALRDAAAFARNHIEESKRMRLWAILTLAAAVGALAGGAVFGILRWATFQGAS